MWKHNTFRKLVDGDSDFIGMVAYTLYKKEKLAWIENQKQQNGEYPTQDIIDKYFHSNSESNENIIRYKEQAVSIVNSFIVATTSEEMITYKNEVRDDEIIKAVTPSWKKRIADGIIITLISTIIVAALNNLYWFNSKIQESKDREALLREYNLPQQVIDLINNPPKHKNPSE